MNMREFALALLFVFSAAAHGESSDSLFAVDGEEFTKKSIGAPPNGDKLIECVRENESFETWTKLIGLRYQRLPGVDNDPKRVATMMAQVVKSRDPSSRSRVIANDKTNEALIDFLTRSPDGAFMEFNVFRYARSEDGNAVLSLQYAYRFTDVSEEGSKRFVALRDSWISQIIAIDIGTVGSTLSHSGRSISLEQSRDR
jgi:hypothetical protein